MINKENDIMNDILKVLDDMVEKNEVFFSDFSELEEVVTPGIGSGCDCSVGR